MPRDYPAEALLEPLRRVWGYDSMRPLQEDVVRAALAGQDAVVVLPTGGGKSLCFQLPPLVDGGLTVVVSPLISLMKDQVDALKLVGYPGDALHSGMPAREQNRVLGELAAGNLRLLYLSPERLLAEGLLDTLRAARVYRFAIDEAHCISHWGHDFRPEYRAMSTLRGRFPKVPIHALTATATPRVREDIADSLGLRDPQVLVGTFDRPNLTYRVVPRVQPAHQVADIIRPYPQDAAIIYCLSRKDTEDMALSLQTLGIQARAYHAGLSNEERRQTSEDFAQERVNVVAATVAFGMGIDRSNVRAVIHATLPSSIEAYQQETGRAGRDGQPSECVMLYSSADIVRWGRLLRASSEWQMLEARMRMLDEVRRYALSQTCRHVFLSQYFGQDLHHDAGCGACDMCLEGFVPIADSTKKAHMILALVRNLAREGKSFGAKHLASVLAGKDASELRRHGHTVIKGFGALGKETAAAIAGWVDQLVDLGLLARGEGRFAVVSLSAAGAQALEERREVALRDLGRPRRRDRGDSDAAFEALRQVRMELARERGVPPYLILSDAVLRQIAARRPKTSIELRRIPGIGDHKLDQFGTALLQAVAQLPVESEEPSERTRVDPLYVRAIQRLLEGAPIEDIAAEIGRTTGTVANYLAEHIERARPASLEPWVDDALRARVDAAIDAVGTERLRPIFEALNEEVPYWVIRLVVAARTENRARP
jgi:ATP-dependent DNA helicase RecQ